MIVNTHFSASNELKLPGQPKFLGWLGWLLLCLVSATACSPGGSSGDDPESGLDSSTGEDLGSAEEEASEEFGPASAPVPIAGTNLTFDNARVVCDFERPERQQARLYCRAVAATFGNTQVRPESIDEGLVIQWLDTRGVNTELEAGNVSCSVAGDLLSQTCDVGGLDPNAVTKVLSGFEVADLGQTRSVQTETNLRFSIRFVAGQVPHMPFSYQPRSETKAQSAGLGLQGDQAASDAQVLDGFFQRPRSIGEAAFAAGSIHDMCAAGGRLYFSADEGVFVYDGESFYAFAGNSQTNLKENLTDRYSIKLGWMSALACSSEALYVADNVENRIIRFSLTSNEHAIIAGGNGYGFSSDRSTATFAQLGTITAMAVGPDGLVYFASTGSDRVRRIRNGVLETFFGDTGPVESRFDPYEFLEPDFFATYGQTVKRKMLNNIFVSDSSFSAPIGDATAVIYNMKTGHEMGNCFRDMALDNINLHPIDYCRDDRENDRLTAQGFGRASFDPNQDIGRVSSMSFDASGELYVSNHLRQIIQRISPGGKQVTLVAGRSAERPGVTTGSLSEAQARPLVLTEENDPLLSRPRGLSFDEQGRLWFASNTRLGQIQDTSVDSVRVNWLAGLSQDFYVYDYYSRFESRFASFEEFWQQTADGAYLQSFAATPAFAAQLTDLAHVVHVGDRVYLSDRSQIIEWKDDQLTSLTSIASSKTNTLEISCTTRKASQAVIEAPDLLPLDENRFVFATPRANSGRTIISELNLITDQIVPIYGCEPEHTDFGKVVGRMASNGDGNIYILADQALLNQGGFSLDVYSLFRLNLESKALEVLVEDVLVFERESIADLRTLLGISSQDVSLGQVSGYFQFGLRFDSQGRLYWHSRLIDRSNTYIGGFKITRFDPVSREVLLAYAQPPTRLVPGEAVLSVIDGVIRDAYGLSGFALGPDDGLYISDMRRQQVYQLPALRASQQRGVVESVAERVIIAGSGESGLFQIGGDARLSPLRLSANIEAGQEGELFIQDFGSSHIVRMSYREGLDYWQMEAMFKNEQKNQCATAIEGSVQSEDALADALLQNASLICQADIDTFRVINDCTTADSTLSTDDRSGDLGRQYLTYTQRFSNLYQSIVQIERPCSLPRQ